MKIRVVLLLMTVAMMISGCQSKEMKTEGIASSTTEYSTEEKSENPSEESVQSEEKNKEDVESVEEAADVKNEETPKSGKENAYKEQMELVYQALAQEWSIDKYFENGISSLISNHYEGSPLENVGYAFKDLDGDGKEELLISAVSKDVSGGMLYDVYTAPNGKVVHVLSGHERNRYYLQWLEEGVYMIANEASNSAYNSAWYYYSLNNGKLELMQGVIFNAAEDEDNPWFITYDEDWDASNDTHDDGVAEAIIEANERSYTTLEYIPFSAY